MSLAMFLAADPATALRWQRSFPGSPDQARAVRRFVTTLIPDCPFLDDVLLGADELVVNALRHTKSGQPGGTLTVEIGRYDTAIAVAVTDQGAPTDPTPADPDPLSESGRGLRTISTISAAWGWFGNSQSRTVTAVYTHPLNHTNQWAA